MLIKEEKGELSVVQYCQPLLLSSTADSIIYSTNIFLVSVSGLSLFPISIYNLLNTFPSKCRIYAFFQILDQQIWALTYRKLLVEKYL